MRTVAILVLVGLVSFFVGCGTPPPPSKEESNIKLRDPGQEVIVDYDKYGAFIDEGTPEFMYRVDDIRGLKKSVGEGIYPNMYGIEKNPLHEKIKALEDFKTDHWELENDASYELRFFRWPRAWEALGVRQLFIAKSLAEGGYTEHAIKAYYACLLTFPRGYGYLADGKTTWWIAPAAINSIKVLIGKNPQLGLKYVGNPLAIEKNDGKLYVSPGRIVGDLVGKDSGLNLGVTEVKIDAELFKQDLVLGNYGNSILDLDYTKYGTFEKVGTNDYKYNLEDSAGLAAVIGEGIWPNTSDVKNNELYKILDEAGLLSGHAWEHTSAGVPMSQYFKWATNNDQAPGVKMFYMAEGLRKAGTAQNDTRLIEHAVKAFHSVLLHFPETPVYAPDGSYLWYAGKASLDIIHVMLRDFPEIGAEHRPLLKSNTWPVLRITNEYDLTIENDIKVIDPGKIVKAPRKKKKPVDLSTLEVVEQRCGGKKPGDFDCQAKVHMKKYSNGHWQLFVDGEPTTVKAVTYDPTMIGESAYNESIENWQFQDVNKNGKIDSPYDSWVDKNRNNIQDADEPSVGDFQLLKEMGANAIRFFYKPYKEVVDGNTTWHYISEEKEKTFCKVKYPHDEKCHVSLNKPMLRELNEKFGIKAMIGDFLGAYTVGSGASWFTGTDYTNEEQKTKMRNLVRDLVTDNVGEDYVQFWILGNENNMNNGNGGINATKTLAGEQPEEFGTFLTEIAEMIHKIDPHHPVVIGNLETQLLEYYEEFAHGIDIVGVNSYRGEMGFGLLFSQVRDVFDRPVMITEYGSDMLNFAQIGSIWDEKSQTRYHKGTWNDIYYNRAGHIGSGNSIGGIAFEWLDEWWKSNQGAADMHDQVQDSPMAFQDGWSSEEWLGLMGQGNGKNTPFQRDARKAYYWYKRTWNKIK